VPVPGRHKKREVAVQHDGIHLSEVSTAIETGFGDAVNDERSVGSENLAVAREGIGALNKAAGHNAESPGVAKSSPMSRIETSKSSRKSKLFYAFDSLEKIGVSSP
jgi:hypothetical protein